jgi:amidophosphoribosyltransferase
MGLVSDTFSRDELAKLPGNTAIGHVRYSTAGSSELRNAQPFLFEYAGGSIAIAHNVNIVKANEMRAEREAQG